jgi:hypothetical protein
MLHCSHGLAQDEIVTAAYAQERVKVTLPMMMHYDPGSLQL